MFSCPAPPSRCTARKPLDERQWFSLKLFLVRNNKITVLLNVTNCLEQAIAVGRRTKKISSLVTFINDDLDLLVLEGGLQPFEKVFVKIVSIHLINRFHVFRLPRGPIITHLLAAPSTNTCHQNTNFNCANSEYKGFAGLITAGSQKSPMFGGQLRDLFVKMSRKPSPVCSVDAPNVSCTLLIRNGRYWTPTL